MKISIKMTVYTGITTLLVGVMILGYFLALLPGLYVDYKIKEEFRYMGYLLDSYQRENVNRKPALSNLNYFFVELDSDDDRIYIDSSFGRSDVVIYDSDIKMILADIRNLTKEVQEAKREEIVSVFEKFDIDKYLMIFQEKFDGENFKKYFSLENTVDYFAGEDMYFQEDSYITSTGGIVFKTQVKNAENEISNYIGLSAQQENFVFVMGSSTTPHLNELLPVIIQSMPMIVILLILFSLLTAFLFSKILVKPIEKLAFHANRMKESENAELISLERNDEFNILEKTLNQLYIHLQDMILRERQQNEKLKLEHERQELFWIHSSHQLKTPVSAAMLLVESMLLKIGKYKNTDMYLPRVKEELIRMQNIVYEMLEIYKIEKTESDMQNVQIKELFMITLEQHKLHVQEKKIMIDITENPCEWYTDGEILFRMIENITENAVKYTPEFGKIWISANEMEFQVINTCIDIDSNIIKQAFLPFVSSTKAESSQLEKDVKGHGLGLYMTLYYANLLGMEVSLEHKDSNIIFSCRIKDVEKPIFLDKKQKGKK